MRTTLLMAVPVILLGGLIMGVLALYRYTPAATPCAVGTCPSLLNEHDSGKTFTYRSGMQFSVILNEDTNPSRSLHCVAEGVIESVGDATPVRTSMYSAPFVASVPGRCVLSDDNFSATIVVE